MRGLDPAVAARLAKIAALLSSSHDGEVVAAAAKATMLLRAHGLAWQDVFTPELAPPQPPLRAPHSAQVQWALGFPGRLTDRERKFLADIGRCRRISAKQAAWLDGIVHKLRQGGGA